MLLSLQVSLCAIKNEIELHGWYLGNGRKLSRGAKGKCQLRCVKDTIKKSMYAGVVLACLCI